MVQKIGKLCLIVATIIIFFRFICFLAINAWTQNMQIDYNLVPIDVFSLFVSSAITIWLGYYVVKKLSEQRFEKEMLINDLRLIEQEIQNIETIFETAENVDITLVSGKMNTIKHLLDRFAYTVRLSENNVNNEIQPINDAFNSLYLASTNFDSDFVNRNDIDRASISYNTNRLILKVRKLTISLNKT